MSFSLFQGPAAAASSTKPTARGWENPNMQVELLGPVLGRIASDLCQFLSLVYISLMFFSQNSD